MNRVESFLFEANDASGLQLLQVSNSVIGASQSSGNQPAQLLAIADETLTYNDHHYRLTVSAKSWEDAQAEAAAAGGSLVTINNAAEEAWLQQNFGQDTFWIGLNDRAQEGQFRWANGESSSYRNWANGEPNDYKFGGRHLSGEDYGVMNWGTGEQWNDFPNTFGGLYRGIIEIADTASTLTYNGHQYRLTDSAKSWEDAQAEAVAAGGNLVTLNNAAEEAWLQQSFGQDTFWIGLNDRAQEGQFRWANGESSSYRNWANNEPNDFKFGGRNPAGEDYGVMNWGPGEQWNDFPNTFGGTYRGIIEIGGSNPNPPNPPNPGSVGQPGRRIEAETAQLGGSAATNTNHPGYSGGGFVDGYTQQGASSTFTINAPTAGRYYTTLRYANGPNGPNIGNGTKTLSVYVNGRDVTQTQLPTTGTWQSWKSKTEILDLKQGENTIAYRYDGNDTGWVNLDYVWTSKAVGNGPVDDPIRSSNTVLDVQKFVKIPDSSNGKRPRINTMAYTGNRLFVGEEYDGRIYEVQGRNNNRQPQLFADLKQLVKRNTGRNLNNQNSWHGGLRGVAFHPNFASNGKFYTSIMEDRPASKSGHTYLSDSSKPIPADSVLVEWTYNHRQNRVNPDSYREVFRVGMPVYDHPIKQIAFNPYARPGSEDFGLLYVGHGDGSVQSATAGGGLNNDALGKVLRINPLQRGNRSYSVPRSNPFVGNSAMLDEVYTLGHRNPHTLSFGRDNQGKAHAIVGEAGRDNIEEVNLLIPGGNYGWADREGTFVHVKDGGGIVQGLEPLPSDDANQGYVYPAVQLGHEGNVGAGFVGQALAGGYHINNGSPLSGQYIYADFAKSGRVFFSDFNAMTRAVTQLNPNDSRRDEPWELTQAPIREFKVRFDHDNNPATSSLARSSIRDVINDESSYEAGSDRADLRFGQGPDGELYITSKRNGYVYLATNSLA